MKVSTNRISDIRDYYTHQLAEIMDAKYAAFMVDSVVAFYSSIERMKLALYPDKRVGESLMLKIHFAVKDLLRNRPLQYVLGETEFYDLRLFVEEGVLIPRPETEELVERVIVEFQDTPNTKRILDLGTGSGCIALSLAKGIKSEVYAVDVSEDAIRIANKNAKANKLNVEFLQLDILDPTSFNDIPSNLDLIISNPPYVRNNEKQLMQANVLDYEPDLALFVEDYNALVFYEVISKVAATKLKLNGVLWFEINEYLSKETKSVVEQSFENVQIFNDYKGQPRFIRAQKTT
jgi:release factor glutamine methyltransferase